ncbi:hypothetical protein L1987_10016 [Smallanthus sonchifolius]|uniref:Uncharacterized protein n=1 Tax=Smallanthus sonchifolius TaxID=185202 RepID=A0ACB9JQX3_9ASTR|nr:hypothetical protein L1987_10016 [Smallanthus sonchifolius]
MLQSICISDHSDLVITIYNLQASIHLLQAFNRFWLSASTVSGFILLEADRGKEIIPSSIHLLQAFNRFWLSASTVSGFILLQSFLLEFGYTCRFITMHNCT